MSNIWDRIWLVNNQSRRDKKRIEYEQSKEAYDAKHKLMQEIGAASTELLRIVQEQVDRQRSTVVQRELVDGIPLLPLYAFYLVMKHQVKPLTVEQTEVIDIYFRSFQFPFTKEAYVESFKVGNAAGSQLLESVGISREKAGSFWVAFFQLLYRTGATPAVLKEMEEKFSDIAMRFSVISEYMDNAIVAELTEMNTAIAVQANQCRNAPKGRVDFYGDESYVDHFRKFKEQFFEITQYSNGGPDPELYGQLFKFFVVGIVYRVISHCNRDRKTKEEMMDRIFAECGMGFSFSAEDVFHWIEDLPAESTTEVGVMAPMVTDPNNGVNSVWNVMAALSGTYNLKTNKDPVAVEECINFLLGMEEMLEKAYPFSGFDGYARRYAGQAMKLINDRLNG